MPVMKLLSSDARKTAAFATSSDVPGRPSGVILTAWATNWSTCASFNPEVLLVGRERDTPLNTPAIFPNLQHCRVELRLTTPGDEDMSAFANKALRSGETNAAGAALLGLCSGQTIMINGGGTITGFTAAQIALLRGAR